MTKARKTQIVVVGGGAGGLELATRLGAPLGISLLGPAGSDRSLVRLAQQIG